LKLSGGPLISLSSIGISFRTCNLSDDMRKAYFDVFKLLTTCTFDTVHFKVPQWFDPPKHIGLKKI